MKILIDTNVILDFLLCREPFFDHAMKLIKIINEDKVQAYITANSVTDIVYVARKTYSLDEIRQTILKLLDRIGVIGVDRGDIIKAFDMGFSDYEDALQSCCAVKEKIDYIITRNEKDFAESDVKPISPDDFLAHHV